VNWIDTVNQTVQIGGNAVSWYEPVGAFFLGMGLMLSMWTLGWMLRQTNWIGHTGGGGE